MRKTSHGKRLVKTFGTSSDRKELLRLEEEARLWIEGQGSLPLFEYEIDSIRSAEAYDRIFESLGQEDLTLVDPELAYGRLFDKLGYGKVQTKDDELFKSLVVTRLYKPGSKLRTMKYLAYFMNKFYDEHRVYRYPDNICYRREKGMTPEEMEAAEKKNIKALEEDGYEYILGARIKSQTEEMKERILSLGLTGGESRSIELAPGAGWS